MGTTEKQYYPPTLLDSKLILGMISEDKEVAINRFKEYNETENEDKFLDDTPRARLSDEEARREIIKLIDGYSITDVKTLPKATRDEILRKVMQIEGLSQRQAARILGISPNLIFKL